MFEFPLEKTRLINYFIAAFIVVTTLLLVRNIINISFSKKKPGLTPGNDISKTATLKRPDIMHYAAILEQNPFGPPLQFSPIVSSMTQKTKADYGPVSDLSLIGTAVGTDNPGYAVFRDKSKPAGKKEGIFTPGNNVFNYGTLKKINRLSVELERDSTVYTIKLPFEKIEAAPEKHATAAAAKSKRSSTKHFAKKVGERTYVLDSRKVQKSLENPQQLLTEARLLPVIKDGRQEGFSISEVVPGGMYHSLGLRNGDTLLKINGLEISNPEVAIQAMSALKGMNSIDLDIIRNGTKMSFSYQLK
jgi:general secretion pathway protein C